MGTTMLKNLSFLVETATAGIRHYKLPARKTPAPYDVVVDAYGEILEALADFSGAVFSVIYHIDFEERIPDDVHDQLDQKRSSITRLIDRNGPLLTPQSSEVLRRVAHSQFTWAGVQQCLEDIEAAHRIISRQHITVRKRVSSS